jgi:hypothetical protein
MRRTLFANRTIFALCANAVLLLLILLAIAGRDGRLLPGSVALGQMQALSQTSSTPGGLSVMPGQIAPNMWGCYVMDTQNQTLSVYQFFPAQPNLKLMAARDISNDRKLGFFNTTPSPTEVREMVERAEEPVRTLPATNRSPENVNP